MRDSLPAPAPRTRLPDLEWEHFMAGTGAAIGTTTTTTTVSSLSVASHSLASATPLVTLMDTDTAIPTAATTLPLTMAVATMGLVTTGLVTTAVDITETVMAAVLMVRFTPAMPTGQALAPNRAWCACSRVSPEPVTIEDPSMELWDLAPATPCVPTSMTMAQATME